MQNSPTVLLVDDDPNDIVFFRNAVEESPLRVRLQTVRDGYDAIEYLKGEGAFGNRAEYPLPGIVILDLHMPRVGGLEVARWIRSQSWLAGLPVVIFTGSDYLRSVIEAMESGADTYVVKDQDMNGLINLLQHMDLGWKPGQRNSSASLKT
jgi:CheY-like chemotaxis protein